MRRLLQVWLVGAVVLAVASVSFAETVNVDFNNGTAGTYSGTAAAPDTGTFWNGVTVPIGDVGYESAPLTASDGTTATSVTVRFTTSVNGYDNSPSTFANPLFGDYAYAYGNNLLGLVVKHLTPSGAYNLYVYNLNGAADGANATYSITTGTESKTVVGAPGSTFVEGTNYAYFANVTASQDGDFGIIVTGAPNGNWIAFNGLQLSSVPEPGTVTLLTTSLIGLLAYAWRKRG